ncbi:hypothetical protein D3C80_1845610 [compost metagenome]
MLRHLDQDIDLRLGGKPRNGRAADMVDGDELGMKTFGDARFFGEEEGRPLAVVEGDLAGERHGVLVGPLTKSAGRSFFAFLWVLAPGRGGRRPTHPTNWISCSR